MSKESTYTQLPDLLFTDPKLQELSLEAKVIYSMMLRRRALSERNGWKDVENRVYIIFTVREIQKIVCCGNQKAGKILKELEEAGMITRKKRGGERPAMIYVEDIKAEEAQETCENHISDEPQTCENHTSTDVKITPLDMWKSHASYIDNSDNKRVNNLISSYQSKIDGCDEIDYNTSMETLKEQVNYRSILAIRPDDEERLNEILETMNEVLCSTKKEIWIKGELRPIEVVKSRFRKVGYFEIQYILDSLSSLTNPVKNVPAYMLATIWNAPATISNSCMMQMGGA